MALARRKIIAKNCPECGYALQEHNSPLRYIALSGGLALFILMAARMCSPVSDHTGRTAATLPAPKLQPPPVLTEASRENATTPKTSPLGEEKAKTTEGLFRQAQGLADEIKFTKDLNASKLAKALARKGSSREIADPELLAAVVYRWVATNISYDVGSLEPTTRAPQNPDFILSDKKAVCEGYACLCDFLLSQNQVESRIVHGIARTEPPGGRHLTRHDDGHAWIIVRWGGAWHLMDPTWGSGSVSRNVFERSFSWDWFDVEPEVAIYTHIPDDDWMSLVGSPIPAGQIEKSARLAPLFFEAIELDAVPMILGTVVFDGTKQSLSWKVRKGYSVALSAASSRKSPESPAIPANEFILPSGISEFSFPSLSEGDYLLNVFARRPGSSKHVSCGAFVLRQSASGTKKQPPVVFQTYDDLGAQLLEPLDGRLKSGSWKRFAIRTKPGLSLGLQMEGETTVNYLSETDGVYEGRILLRKGKLRLWRISGKKMHAMMEFSVE